MEQFCIGLYCKINTPSRKSGGPLAHHGADEAVAVVHRPPRCNADGDNLTFLEATAHTETPHCFPNLLHNTSMRTTADDPGTFGTKSMNGLAWLPRFFCICCEWRQAALPVVWATLTSPLLKTFFNLNFMLKFLAPPVTDIKRFGTSRPQCCVISW